MKKRFLYIIAAVIAAVTLILSAGCAVNDEGGYGGRVPGVYTDESRAGDTASGQAYSDGAEQADKNNPNKDNPDKDDSEGDTHDKDAPDEKAPQTYGTRSNSARKGEIDEDGEYTSKDDVALYIHTYNKLPGNFITKDEAEDLGWHGGGLDKYAPGMSIGGDRFGNYEGSLPEKRGRTYRECDIDTRGKKSRGAKRIVFSNDGLIYYTGDHYETFELLYGEE